MRTDTYYTSEAARFKTVWIYDGLGRVRVRTDYNWYAPYGVWSMVENVRYIYDGMRVIQGRNGSNTPLVSYTRGNDLSGSLEGAGGIGGLLGRSHGYSAGSWSTHNHYHADGNGNVTYLVNSSQGEAASYRYDPYGRLMGSSGTLAAANLYRFSSKELHVKSGMYYYGYRFYEPHLQRWINRDPIEEAGHQLLRSLSDMETAEGDSSWGHMEGFDTTEINEYGFVANNPTAFVDSLGLRRLVGPCNAKQRNWCIQKCKKEKKLMLSCRRITVTIRIRGISIPFSRTKCICADPKEPQPIPPLPDPACDVGN